MILYRANVYRLAPTEDQNICMARWAGACRFVYNLAIEQRRDWHRPGRYFSYHQQAAELTLLRAEVDWLRAVPVHALQCALRAAENSFERFFSGNARYPRMHKKGAKESFTLPDPAYLGFKRLNKNRGAIRLPKIGWVKFVGFRPLPGSLRSVTVSRRAGHWYVSVKWRMEVLDPAANAQSSVGIDRGVSLFAALSDGTKFQPISSIKAIGKRISNEQRKLSRKKKFSSNWKKQSAKVNRLYRHEANIRKDFLHKISIDVAKNHGVVKIENLRVRNLTASARGTCESPGRNIRQKSALNRSILAQGWSMFAAMLKYKLEERGGLLIEVDPAYTSQTCSCCGTIDKASRKDQATFECGHCGHAENADVNAAKNILQAKAIAVEPPKRTLRRVGKRKQPRESVV